MRAMSYAVVAMLVSSVTFAPAARAEEVRYEGKTAPEWAAALRNATPEERVEISVILRFFGSALGSAIPLLVEIASGTQDAGIAAGNVLKNAGALAAPAVPKLTELARDEQTDYGPRARAVDVLGRIGAASAPAVPMLLRLLEDANELFAPHVIEALGRIGPPALAAVPALVGRGADPEPDARAAAITALGRITSDARAVGAVRVALADVSIDVRGAAAAAYLRMTGGLGEARRAFEQALDHETARLDVEFALSEMGPASAEALPFLLARLSAVDPQMREEMAETLETLAGGGVTAPPYLVKALDDSVPRVRWLAAVSLARIGASASVAVSPLTKRLSSRTGTERVTIAMALVRLSEDDAQYVPILVEGLSAPGASARKWSLEALAWAGPQASAALPRLRVFSADDTVFPEERELALKTIRAIEGK